MKAPRNYPRLLTAIGAVRAVLDRAKPGAQREATKKQILRELRK